MAQKIRLWAVVDNQTLKGVPESDIGLEKRLHDWLEKDIAVLDPDLLVIGREVRTQYGGGIDLLCIDRDGGLVVVEIKQGRTPREVAAQALDYASWVKDLEAGDIERIAEEYPRLGGSLEDALQERFGEVPDALNESHRALIVAEAIDDSTERIVRYLSELGVPINVATVQAFRDANGQEMLARVFLVEPDVARDRARGASRASRKRYRTASEMEALADSNSLGDLYRRVRRIREVMKAPIAYYTETTSYSWRFEGPDGRRVRAALMVQATGGIDNGLEFQLHASRCCDYLKIPLEQLRAMLPADARESDVRNWVGSSPEERQSAIGLSGAFRSIDEVDAFVAKLTEAAARLETT